MNHTHRLSFTLPGAWDDAIDRWMTWLIASGASPATRRTRRAHLRSIARDLAAPTPHDVSRNDLLAILGRPEYSTEYRRSLRASLTAFYRWSVMAGLVDGAANPTDGLPAVRAALGAPRPATDDIWCQIMAGADARTLLMARLAGEAGLRRAEVAQVHTNDLLRTSDGAQLIVHGKGGKQRVVPVTPALADEIAQVSTMSGYLFPGKINGHISPDRVGHLVSEVMPSGWSMHKLRHRYATRGYAGTRNLRAVQEALGHASVATTQRYTAVSAHEIRSVSDAAAWRPLDGDSSL